MTKVTICAYDKPDNVGGPISWLRRLVPLLRERGIEVRCQFIMHYGETGPALTPLSEAGFECVWTQLDRTEDRIRWILEDLRAHPPDVFVPNLVVAAYHAARWAREAGIPTVGILHSDDSFYRALQQEFVFGGREQALDAIVCVSRSLESEVIGGRPPGTVVRRIPYGISIPDRTVERRPGRLRLSYVGRLAEEQKRITEVVRALGRAVAEVRGVSAILYGDGPERRKVANILGSDFAGRDIELAGVVDSEEIQSRMLEVDAIVLLSDFEGRPLALLEAMACGCVPVCLAARSGIPELVTDGETGLVVSDRGDGFVNAVRSLAEDTELWARLSRKAREKALAYSAASSADAWAALFQDLAGAARLRTEVAIPATFRLPPINPDLASADRRALRPRLLSRLVSGARMKAGELRRRLLR